MNITLSRDGQVSLAGAGVSLHGIVPVVNGAPLHGAVAHVRDVQTRGGHATARLEYTAPGLQGGAAGLEVYQTATDRCELRYWIAGLPESVTLDSFGIRFQAVENLGAFLRNGYFSWDGSSYIHLAATREPNADPAHYRGYAMTQLLARAGAGSLVMGFDRHDRFQQAFDISLDSDAPTLTVLTLWDRHTRTGLNRCESERLIILEHPTVEDALRAWARIVAGASPTPPRLASAPITGWCSWYNLYAAISEENLLEHLRGTADVARRERLPMRFFQIDDGFTPEMGDWLAVKPQYPRGIKPLLDDIRTAGFTPGLWIAPFVVGNRSQLYRDHPDWVVRDRQTDGPLALMTFYGEFRWHKRSEEYYVLDTTHPDAFAYLRHVFRTWRHDWGCEYFKTDFMHFPTEHGPDRAIWHEPGLTRIAIWRQVAEMIREEIGDATWLGCGCPLWASVGLVDGVRIGRDVGARWHGEQSAQSLLQDQATRNYANHILWETDPDCVLLRERFHHLTVTELRSLAIYAGMAAGVVMTSDALHELPAERLRLWKLILTPEIATCRYPFLGQHATLDQASRDPVLIQVRTPDSGNASARTAVFAFNTSDTPVVWRYALDTLGLAAPAYVYDWTAGQPWPNPVEALSGALQPHDGALLFVSQAPFDDPPERLP